MSYRGRLLGALIGFFLPIPFGTVLGFILGWALYDNPRNKLAENAGGAGYAFKFTKGYNETLIYGTFALLGYVASGGGVIRREQIMIATQCMNMMKLDDPQSRRRAQEAFNQGKSEDFNLELETIKLKEAVGRNAGVISYLLEILVQMALADAVVEQEEHRRLCEIAQRLGVPVTAMERLIQIRIAEMQFRRGFYRNTEQNGSGYEYSSQDEKQASQETSASSLADAYRILGVSEDASWDEVRKAHKRLMLKYHPDRLKSQGVPEEMIRTYTEKAKDIQAAFDCIKRSRGEKN